MNINFNFFNENGDFIFHVKDGEPELNYAYGVWVTPAEFEIETIEIKNKY